MGMVLAHPKALLTNLGHSFRPTLNKKRNMGILFKDKTMDEELNLNTFEGWFGEAADLNDAGGHSTDRMD